MSSAKPAKPTEVSFGLWTRGAQGTMYYVGILIFTREGGTLGGKAWACGTRFAHGGYSQPYSLWNEGDAASGYQFSYCSNLLFCLRGGGALSNASIRPSVCLAHARRSKTVYFRAKITTEH